jgi:class 3 adenylate cyclase
VTDRAACPRCAAARSSACPDCGAASAPGANFCSSCGRPLNRPGAPPPSAAEHVWAPPHLLGRVLESRAALEGERKQVTVLFADLRGSLGVIADVDPEDGQALLDAVLTTMVSAVHRFEGAVNQVMGDGIMALFGAPLAHEDHALRAACAALAMQDAVANLRDPAWEAHGTRPQIRVGLNSGEVAIRSVRSDLSMEYRAVGSTTHIAARMEQLAAPGAVLLTGETFRLGGGMLRARALGPMPIKGVPEPIEVYELSGISVRTRFQASALRGLSPLVGREETLGALARALAAAAAGQSRAAVLFGDPGVGKSRLCHELLNRAAERFRVLEASALSYASATPHGVLASMVRSLFGIDDEDDVERLVSKARACLSELGEDETRPMHVLLELLDVPSHDRDWARLDPVQKRRRIEETLRALLAAWCARGPAVLLCEDLHWCDADSLAFIASLVDSPPGSQTLLLLTHRSDVQPPWAAASHVLSCRIAALEAADAEALLTSLLGNAQDLAPLRQRLAERTDGNPFFIEESVRAVLESGRLHAEAGGLHPDRVDVPASIDALLGARIDRLPEAALEILQAAAVIGGDVHAEVLRAVAELDAQEFNARLGTLTRAELLFEAAQLSRDSAPSTRMFRFKHALIQEVVYKRLLRPRKRALHARAVEVFELHYSARIAEHVERLAEHAYRAELWDKCAQYEKLACLRAASRSANGQAVLHLDRAIEALLRVAAGPERDRAAIDIRLIALAPLLPLGAHDRVIQLLREAEQLARELADVGRLARVASQLSAELWLTANYELALRSAEEALALLTQLPGDQFALASSIHYNIAMIHHARGAYDAALLRLHALLPQFSGANAQRRLGWAGYPSVLVRTFIVSVASMTGNFAEAERMFEEGCALADQLDHPFSRTMIREQYGLCLLVKGEPEAAARILQQALDVCLDDEVHTMYMPIASHLGMALLELGKLEQARTLIEHAARAALDRVGHYAITYSGIAQSLAQLYAGDVAAALSSAERALHDTQGCGELGFQVRAQLQYAAALAQSPGRQADAAQAYAEALAQARELAMPPWAALAQQGLAALHEAAGRPDLAGAALEAALRIWRELAAPARVAELSAWRARLAS